MYNTTAQEVEAGGWRFKDSQAWLNNKSEASLGNNVQYHFIPIKSGLHLQSFSWHIKKGKVFDFDAKTVYLLI